MTEGSREDTMSRLFASRASLVSVVFLLITVAITPSITSASESGNSVTEFEFYQNDGHNASEILSLNGTANIALQQVEWQIVEFGNGLNESGLKSGDYLTSVTPSGEQHWSWTLVVDVSGMNCTCVLEVYLSESDGTTPIATIVLYLGHSYHYPVLHHREAPSEPLFLLTAGNLVVGIDAISPLGTLDDSVLNVRVCEAPNSVCLKEAQPMKLNSSISNHIQLLFNATTFPLDDGFWMFSILLEDRTLTASNEVFFIVQIDRQAPSVMLSNSITDESHSVTGDLNHVAEGTVYEHEEVLFTAEVSDGYQGGSEVLTWSKINPSGQQSAFASESFITESSVSLLPDEAGEWTVVLLVRDSAGHLIRTTSTFMVENSPPIAHLALDGLEIQHEDTIVVPNAETWLLNASKTIDTLNDQNGLTYRWYVDEEMVQTGGTTFESSKINASGTYEIMLIVLDDDGANSTISFSMTVPQDVVSGSEDMLGGNLFTIALVSIIAIAGFLVARMGATEQETSLPKWQRKKD